MATSAKRFDPFTLLVILIIILIAPTILGMFTDAKQQEKEAKAAYESAILE